MAIARICNLVLLTLALAMTLLVPAAAYASFEHAQLLSDTSEQQFGTAAQQFEAAGSPALSQSGEYVAFSGVLAGKPGVYRRDTRTGFVELVAGGDAAAPSISAEGRYIAFTTSEDLEPAPAEGQPGEPEIDRGCPEVYVRDMDKRAPDEATGAAGEAGAYTLASALSGSEAGIKFEGAPGCGQGQEKGLTIAGAQAAPAVALSGDGELVAFTVLSSSNLAGPGVSPGQVAVRDLRTRTTTLVSVTPGGEPVQEGGAFPDVYACALVCGQGLGAGHTNAPFGDQPTASSAAISSDGSAVAWVGMNVARQVSATEAAREPALSQQEGASEAEPLWRRISSAQPSTRRLLAGAGLAFFGYNPYKNEDNPVEAGAFIGTQHRTAFVTPALSANGEVVALVSTAPPPSAESSLIGRNTNIGELSSDAYLVRIGEEASLEPQVIPLTEIPSYAAQPNALGAVEDVAISPDGSRVAFDTGRTPLESSSLATTSPPAESLDSEIYEANLELGTLQRLTTTYDEAEANGSPELISFGADDKHLAFGSNATNLFFGDAEPTPQVYETAEIPSSAQVVSPQISEAPPSAPPALTWSLSATAVAQPDGSVLIYALVPGAGRLGGEVRAQLPAIPSRGKPERSDRADRHEAHARGASAVRLLTRTVAHGALGVTRAMEAQIRIRVSSPYKTLLTRPGGLYALLRVTFFAPGHGTLVQSIPLTLYKRAVRASTKDRRKGTSVKGAVGKNSRAK